MYNVFVAICFFKQYFNGYFQHYINFTVEFLRAFGGTHNRHRTMPHITPDVMAATNEQLEAVNSKGF